ncbi:potassium-transporting ATPase subunit KdpB [uncultured Faecalibaculum sp.]|uniref:potassium-transporting ATPase subunit KdpB n=1 Tax=uncultured Faecalibaculum sp. TaxID=1729681 RepID=UPI00262BDE48|nr:potassium-transporting ATPase subunit KdpB [uncultured Faecalibaculum sp.]
MNKTMIRRAILDSFRKLNPRTQAENPVMFLVYLSAITVTCLWLAGLFGWQDAASGYTLAVAVILWFTCLFANFAEAIAEGRGKAQADSLRKAKKDIEASRIESLETMEQVTVVNSTDLHAGDLVVVRAGDMIPADGDVIYGAASVDESAITGESAPVIREAGGDRCAVTGGTTVLSDVIVVSVTAEPGKGFLDKMIAMVEGAARKKTPNEIALQIFLIALTVIFVLVTISLYCYSAFASREQGVANPTSITTLLALLVCLAPTTIGALLSAIGIAGMSRLNQENVLAMSGRAIEAAGDVDVLLLDKTGTITLGNRQAAAFLPVKGVSQRDLAYAAVLSSLADETPEGRSVLQLAREQFGIELAADPSMEFIPFTAATRMSGVIFQGQSVRKGAADSVKSFARVQQVEWPADCDAIVEDIARSGGTPLVVLQNDQILGVIHLKDIIKQGVQEKFADMRRMGIKTIMITGDNPLTAAAIAAEAGVDDFLAEATPQGKLDMIREYQKNGHLVAMTGDGTNDAPALAQADVAVAMNTGTQAAKEAGNMVDLDSSPTKLIQIVRIGKQLLMTRGALTTFSIANDAAKYFAIIPALFTVLYPGLEVLNIMHLHSAESAILSAVIFNALIIVALIPLALKGVKYRELPAGKLLSRNLLIYGCGGIVTPFVCIKLIDMVISLLI